MLLMLQRKKVVLRWYVNVCARVLCARIHTKFQMLEVNETISEGLVFPISAIILRQISAAEICLNICR